MKYSLKEIGLVKVENEEGVRCFLMHSIDTIGYGVLKYYGVGNTQFLEKFVLFEIKNNIFTFSVAQ